MPAPIRLFASFALLLTALALPTAESSAQYELMPDTSTLARELDRGISELSESFWNTRFAGYKRKIDGMLPSSTLIELNELRARYLLAGEAFRNVNRDVEVRIAAETDSIYGSTSDERYVEAPVLVEDESEYGISLSGEQELEDPARSSDSYSARQLASEVELLEERLAGRVEFAIPAPAGQGGTDFSRRQDLMRELTETRFLASWITRKSRPVIDTLFETFVEDYREFRKLVRSYAGRFYKQHRKGVGKDPQAIEALHEALSIGSYLSYMVTGDRPVQRGAVEAILLLYNGQNLREIDWNDPPNNWRSPFFPGPDTPTAEISFDPVARRATISLILKSPATFVQIGIIDSLGKTVETFDPESRPAGSHAASIDLATLPAGWYLCQLTIRTAAGEELHTQGIRIE